MLALPRHVREDCGLAIYDPGDNLEERPITVELAGHKHHPALMTISVYKFVKAALSLLSAVVAWRLTNPHVEAAMHAWAETLPQGFSEHLVREALAAVSGIPAFRWRQLGFVSLLYATLFTVEGVGLWRERSWAEYLTIVTSSLLLPFEFIAVLHHPTLLRTGVLIANAAIVAYLIVWTLRRRTP
jgi:uncharacterized membrane protein (DUF2068 family)